MQEKHIKYLTHLSCLSLISATLITFQSNAGQDKNIDIEKEIVKPIKSSEKRQLVPTPVPEDWSQSVHDSIANSVHQSASWFDAFFTDNDTQQTEPKTVAKIRLSWSPRARDWAEFETRFRLKVKLPHLKDKMSLILSDEDDIQDSQLPLDRISNRPDNDDSFAAAIRYIVKKDDHKLIDTRVGISGGDFFAKARHRKLFSVGDKHGFKIEPSTYYYLDDGLGAKLLLEYSYQYHEKSQYRINYSIRGSESFSGIRWKHGFYQLNQISSSTASVFGLQVEGERNGDKGFYVDNYTLSYRYRFNALEKWLFFEVEPFLEWVEEENYKTTPGITFRVEGYFSKN